MLSKNARRKAARHAAAVAVGTERQPDVSTHQASPIAPPATQPRIAPPRRLFGDLPQANAQSSSTSAEGARPYTEPKVLTDAERRAELRRRLQRRVDQQSEQRNNTVGGHRLSKQQRREAAEKLKAEGLDDVDKLMDQFGVTDGERRAQIRDAAAKRQTSRVLDLLKSAMPLPEGADIRVRSESHHVRDLTAQQRAEAERAGLLKPGE